MEIVKKILVVLSLILVLVIGFYYFNTTKTKDEVITLGLDVSDTIRDLFNGETDLNKISSKLSLNAKNTINETISKLKDRENVGFNLSKYYDMCFNNLDANMDDVADDVLDPISEEALNYVVDESFLVSNDYVVPQVPNDSRIYKENNEDYIKVKDLVFTDDLTYIDYNNTTLLLSIDDMPLTYSNLIKSNDYRFMLKDYTLSKVKGCYNLLVEYISFTNMNILKVNLVIDDNIVKDIKIEVVEGRLTNG